MPNHQSHASILRLINDTIIDKPIYNRYGDEVDSQGVQENINNTDLLLQREETECLLCRALVHSRDGMYKHFIRSHIEVWNGLVEWSEQGEPTMPIRTNASNRQVYTQMRLWGWTEEKKTNLEVVMRHPNGSTLKVSSPESHSRNQPPVLIAIYQMTGVTPEEFWDKVGEDEARFLPPEPSEPDRNISTRLLELLIGQGRPLTTPWMAEAMGFTQPQVQHAMTYMKSRHLVRRVKRGMWQSVEHREVTETQTVGMTVTTNQTETLEKPLEAPVRPADPIDVPSTILAVETPPAAPQAVPVPAHREVTDDDVYQVLDLLVPDGFRAKHFPAVRDWVDATKALVNALRES